MGNTNSYTTLLSDFGTELGLRNFRPIELEIAVKNHCSLINGRINKEHFRQCLIDLKLAGTDDTWETETLVKFEKVFLNEELHNDPDGYNPNSLILVMCILGCNIEKMDYQMSAAATINSMLLNPE